MEKEQQIQMCGESFEELRDQYWIHRQGGSKEVGMLYIMGFLSDAQSLMEMGQKEQARQILNGAKYLISEYHLYNSKD